MLTLTVAGFRTALPDFTSDVTYTDAAVTLNLETAQMYISSDDYGVISGTSRERAIYLMTAHLFALSALITAGQTPGMVQSSGIDKISVSLTPPPVKTQFQWWLSLTGYGQQLLAMFVLRSVGGLYVGGSAERSNFRKFDGSF
jgi:hypothetical protein